jgi:hypothetical protein
VNNPAFSLFQEQKLSANLPIYTVARVADGVAD